MRRPNPRRFIVLAACLLVLPFLLAFGFMSGWFSEDTTAVTRNRTSVVITTALTPHVSLFGDQVRAVAMVTVDKDVIDPGNLTFRTDFLPYRIVSEPRITKTSYGSTTAVRYETVLECLGSQCPPFDNQSHIRFKDLVVRYREHGVASAKAAVASWPALTVRSRLLVQDIDNGNFETEAFAKGTAPFIVSTRFGWSMTTWLWAIVLASAAFTGSALVFVAAFVRRRSRGELPGVVSEDAAIPSMREVLVGAERGENVPLVTLQKALDEAADALEEKGYDALAREAKHCAWSPAGSISCTPALLRAILDALFHSDGGDGAA